MQLPVKEGEELSLGSSSGVGDGVRDGVDGT